MKKKYFTFLYVPSQNTGLKTIRVPRLLVYGLAIALVGLVTASTIALLKYASQIGDTYRVTQLSNENEVLKSQLENFTRDLTDLERHVQQNFDFQKKARLMANLDDISEDVAEVGVGGPDVGYIQSMSVLDENTRVRVSDLREDIDKLVRQATLQTESYREVISQLSEEQRRLDATPSIRPVPRGYVSSRFGRRMDPITGRSSFHYGVDYSVRLGTPIYATGDGIVTYAGKWSGFGLTVEISHGFDYVTRYAHTSKILVRKGQKIKRGDVIARVGSSGRSTATHLHYEVLQKGKKKNPLAFVLTGSEVMD
jgi:murein DD-endopeptidase MepM/ murein hydrolase activator NlpD